MQDIYLKNKKIKKSRQIKKHFSKFLIKRNNSYTTVALPEKFDELRLTNHAIDTCY